jgi:hypothetical protein
MFHKNAAVRVAFNASRPECEQKRPLWRHARGDSAASSQARCKLAGWLVGAVRCGAVLLRFI